MDKTSSHHKCFGWVPASRKEPLKMIVLQKSSQLIAHGQVDISFGESGLGNSSARQPDRSGGGGFQRHDASRIVVPKYSPASLNSATTPKLDQLRFDHRPSRRSVCPASSHLASFFLEASNLGRGIQSLSNNPRAAGGVILSIVCITFSGQSSPEA